MRTFTGQVSLPGSDEPTLVLVTVWEEEATLATSNGIRWGPPQVLREVPS